MTQSIGWWEWDPEADAMTIASTGERVAYLGPFSLQAELDLPGEHWLLFEYRSHDTRYPVLVQSGSYISHGQSRTTSIYLRLDHIGSARLWARQTAMQFEYPPYLLWSRVDELMVDAISCWPRDLVDGNWLYRLYVNGGWSNGEWSENYLRRFHHPRGLDCPPEEDVVTSNLGAEPDAVPTWQYVHVESPANHFDLAVKAASNERQTRPQRGRPGLEASMPHLTRKSGSAVLFPSRAYVSQQDALTYLQGGMPNAKGLFRYADLEVSCLIAGNPCSPRSDALFPTNPYASGNRRFLRSSNSEFCTNPQFHEGAARPWEFSIAVTDHRFEYPDGSAERQSGRDPLGVTGLDESRRREHLSWLVPELGLWRRLRSALLQAWAVWPGRMSALVAEEDAEAVRRYNCQHGGDLLELPLPPASEVRVVGAYVGGHWMSDASVIATCLLDWRLKWEEPTLLELTRSPGGPARPHSIGRRKTSGIG